MSAFNASVAAVKSIAETTGVSIKTSGSSGRGILELLAQETEFRVLEMISPVTLLMEFTNTKKLTAKHVNEVLKSQGIKPLLGYTEHGDYDVLPPQAVGDRSVYVMSDQKVELGDVVKEQIPAPSRETDIKTEAKMIQGVKVTSNHSASSVSKGIRRRLPITSIFTATGGDSASQKEINEEKQHGISKELCSFYQEITDALMDDNKVVDALFKLGHFGGINPIVPYLLHYFISQIAQNLDSFATMKSVGSACVALAKNPTVQVDFYAHPLAHIGYTLALKRVVTGSNDDDCYIRDIGANIVSLVAERCSSSYPNCSVEFFNQYAKYLFDGKNEFVPLAYGALSGIFSLGAEYYSRVLPHLKLIIKWAKGQEKYEGHACLINKLIHDEAKRAITNHVQIEKSAEIIKYIEM